MLRWLIVASLVVSVAGVMVSLALGVNERDSAANRARSQPSLRDIRACAYEAFSKRLGRCTRDQRGQVVYTSQVVCSATLADPNATVQVAMGWRYGGGSIWSDSLVGRGKTVWTTFSLGGPFPIPRGEYRCHLTVGSTSLVSVLKSSGPAGEVVDTAICDYRRSQMHFRNRSCLQDDDGGSVTPGSGVVCNAAFVRVTGRRAAVRLLDANGQNVAPPFSSVVRTPLYWTYKSSGSRRLPSGQYRCQFVLDGVVMSEKSLTINAP